MGKGDDPERPDATDSNKLSPDKLARSAAVAGIVSSMSMGWPGLVGTLIGSLLGALARRQGAKHEISGSDLRAARFEDETFGLLQSDDCPVGFFVKDLANRYAYVNRAFTDIFKRPANEIIGRTDWELYPDEDEASVRRDLEDIIEGKVIHRQRVRIVHGFPKTVMENLVAKRGPGYEPVGIYGICSTIDQPGEVQDLSDIQESESQSPTFALTLGECERVAPTEAHVLLTGESGSGKDFLARYIHDHSKRSSEEFYALTCSNLNAGTFESELFGHVKGAYTGAIRDKPGLVETAEEGTLFLNEIGEVPFHLQSKLLEFLQYKTFTRMGETKKRPANVRIVAATRKDLQWEVQNGTFRDDLFHRLNVFHIHVPPLRQRLADIPSLSQVLLKKICDQEGIKKVPELDNEVLHRLSAYDWPGNVRELENVLYKALMYSKGGRIRVADIRVGPQSLRRRDMRQTVTAKPRPKRPSEAELKRIYAEIKRGEITVTQIAAERGGHRTVWSKWFRDAGLPPLRQGRKPK